jgi:hypothetical protein
MDNDLEYKHKISFPQEKTYFIAYTDKNTFQYGEVDIDQEMVTGQPYIFVTTDPIEWIRKMTDFNYPSFS